MLKLVYFYYESLRGFEKPEFNFTSKYKIGFYDCILSISHDDKNFINDFFGKDIEISAVVGNNGSGKSSLMKKLKETITNQTAISLLPVRIPKKILVFESTNANGTELIIYYNSFKSKYRRIQYNGEEIHVDLNKDLVLIDPLEKHRSVGGLMMFNARNDSELDDNEGITKFDSRCCIAIRCAYITQVLDKEMYSLFSPDDSNLSTGGFLRQSRFPNTDDQVIRFFHKEFEEQIELLYEFHYSNTPLLSIPFTLPYAVKIRYSYQINKALESLFTPEELNEIKQGVVSFLPRDEYTILANVIEYVDEKTNSFNEESSPYGRMITELLATFLIEISDILSSEYRNTRFCIDKYEHVSYGKTDGLFEFVSYCFNNYLSEYNRELFGEKSDIGNRLEGFFFFFEKEIKKCEKRVEYETMGEINPYDEGCKIANRYKQFLYKIKRKYNLKELTWASQSDNYFYVPFQVKPSNDTHTLNQTLKEFYDDYRAVVKNVDFLQFEWGLSSGEIALLNLYVKFNRVKKSIRNEKKYFNEEQFSLSENNINVFLLIDEADMLLHPQWQQDYIKNIVNGIKLFFSEMQGVHVILSSHSPIMLSDIPRQNLIYLQKEKKHHLTTVVPRVKRHETFGANIFRLFRDTFFLEGAGIGTFAVDKMQEIIDMIHQLQVDISEERVSEIQKYISAIGDPYIRQRFEQELNETIKKLDKNMSDVLRRKHLEYLRSEVKKLESELTSND